MLHQCEISVGIWKHKTLGSTAAEDVTHSKVKSQKAYIASAPVVLNGSFISASLQ
jgi:hypothetical protein